MHIKRSTLRNLITEVLEEMDDLATSTDDFMDAEEELAVAQDARNPSGAEALINSLLNMIEQLDP